MFVSGVRNLETETFCRAEPGDKPCDIKVMHTGNPSKCLLCSQQIKGKELFQAAVSPA